MSAEPYLSRSGSHMSIPRLVLCHWWTNGQGTQIEARDTQADLVSLERIGKKTAESLLAEIEKSKTLPLNRLLFGLTVHSPITERGPLGRIRGISHKIPVVDRRPLPPAP